MSISDLFLLNNLSGSRVFFDCFSFLQAALMGRREEHQAGAALAEESLL